MTQENVSKRPTLEAILAQYLPKEALFKRPVKNGEDIITSQVSRNPNGVILYVVPGSTKYIQRSSKPDATTTV